MSRQYKGFNAEPSFLYGSPLTFDEETSHRISKKSKDKSLLEERTKNTATSSSLQRAETSGETVKKVARNHWLVACLLFLFIFPIVTTPSAALPNPQSSSRFSPSTPSPPPPYGPFAPVGQYNGSSNPTQALATYNKSLNVKTPSNDTQDFSVDLAPTWNSYMDVSITEISTSLLNIPIDTNTTDTSSEEPIALQQLAISFQITNSCTIANFSAYLNVVALGNIYPNIF